MPILPFAHFAAVDEQFVGFVASDLHFARLGLGHVEAAAEVAASAGRPAFEMFVGCGRPNPLRRLFVGRRGRQSMWAVESSAVERAATGGSAVGPRRALGVSCRATTL